MNKNCSLIICALFTLFLCGCSNFATIAQSEKNFNLYEENLYRIVEEKNLSLSKIESDISSTDTSVVRNYEVLLNDSQIIHVNLSNIVVEPSDSGAENFRVCYHIDNSSQNFEVDTMVSLINTVSGKKVTKEYIDWFLSASEEECSAEKYGMTKTEDKVVYKFKPLNFLEDWVISYVLYDDGAQELVFRGLTDTNR